MKEFTAKVETKSEAMTGLAGVRRVLEQAGELYGAYIGLDVHKETIAVAIAEYGRAEPAYYGEIANTPKKVTKLIERLSARYGGERLLWVYEAGPCG